MAYVLWVHVLWLDADDMQTCEHANMRTADDSCATSIRDVVLWGVLDAIHDARCDDIGWHASNRSHADMSHVHVMCTEFDKSSDTQQENVDVSGRRGDAMRCDAMRDVLDAHGVM